MPPEFSAFTEFPRPTHPGSVTFVGTDGTERTEPADQLPDWLKFAAGPDGQLVPVVLVVRVSNGQGFGLRSYGPAGRLLSVTLPVPPSPPTLSEVASRTATVRQRPADVRPAGSGVSGWF
jgi:hypothetical protein